MTENEHVADATLMNQLTASQGENDKPLEELVVRHEQLVLNTLLHVNIRAADADDIASIVWEKVWQMGKKGSWNASRAGYSTDPFVPLLKTITKNLAMDFHRKSARQRKRMGQIKELAVTFGDDWRTHACARPGKRRATKPVPSGVPDALVAGLSMLPERLREAYRLHAEGLGCRQIALRLKCSPASACRWVAQARKELGRQELTQSSNSLSPTTERARRSVASSK